MQLDDPQHPTTSKAPSTPETTGPSTISLRPESGRDQVTHRDQAAAALSPAGIQHDCLRNALYHAARAGHYELCNRWLNLAIIVLGLGASTDFLSAVGTLPLSVTKFMAFTAGVLAALQLTFDLGSKNKDHDFLRRRCFALYANTQNGDTREEECKKELALLFADEPVPTYRAVDATAYNQASDRLGSSKVIVSRWQKVTKNWVPFANVKFAWEDKAQPSNLKSR